MALARQPNLFVTTAILGWRMSRRPLIARDSVVGTGSISRSRSAQFTLKRSFLLEKVLSRPHIVFIAGTNGNPGTCGREVDVIPPEK